MSWVPPSSGGHPSSGGGYPPSGYSAPPPVPPPSVPPPAPVNERQARAERALRALPPPPNPPAGMGARPAFAPPVPRRNRTVLIVSLALGATLLLCCGGGVFGVGGLVYYTYNGLQDDAVSAVESYLGELQAGRYQQAYSQLCGEARTERTYDEFASDEETVGQVLSFSVNDTIGADEDSNWLLTAHVVRRGGAPRTETFPVTFNDENVATVCPV